MDSLLVNLIQNIVPNMPNWLITSVKDIVLLLIGGLITSGALYAWLKRNWVTIGVIFHYIDSLIQKEQGNSMASGEMKKQNVIQAYTAALENPANKIITNKVDKVMKILGGVGKVIEWVLPFVKKNNPKIFGKN